MNNEQNDVYDTKIYLDFSDLPTEKQNALYDEWINANPAEKRIRQIERFSPLIFGAVIIGFIIAALVLMIARGIGVISAIMLGAAGASLAVFIIYSIHLSKTRTAQLRRFVAWLKSEKNIIAELKVDIKNQK